MSKAKRQPVSILDPDALLRPNEVARQLGVCRATLYNWKAQGILPKPIQLTAACVAWRASEIREFIAARAAASRA